MYCRYCGNQLDEDGLCENCNIVFETESPQQQPVIYINQKQEEPPTSSFAVWGFILAIVQFFLDGGLSTIIGFMGMIFSFVGMSQTSGRAMRGRGFAIWGLIITLTPFIIGFLDGYFRARGYY